MSSNHARAWQRTHAIQPEKQTKQVTVKVNKQGWITKGEKAIFAIAAASFICVGLFTVSVSSSTDSLNREVQNLETKIEKQQVVNDGLAQEVKEYSRPERIIETARKKGLEPQNSEVKQASGLAR